MHCTNNTCKGQIPALLESVKCAAVCFMLLNAMQAFPYSRSLNKLCYISQPYLVKKINSNKQTNTRTKKSYTCQCTTTLWFCLTTAALRPEWSPWSPCDATCGYEGKRVRSLECMAGDADPSCVDGARMESVTCDLLPCPGMGQFSHLCLHDIKLAEWPL